MTEFQLRIVPTFDGIFTVGQIKDIAIGIREGGRTTSEGIVTFLIPAVKGFKFTFNPAKLDNANPAYPVNNSLFNSLTYLDGTIFISSNNVIPALSALKVSVDIEALDFPNTTYEIKAILLPGSGGDVNIANNVTTVTASIV